MTEKTKGIIDDYMHSLKEEGINKPKWLFDTPFIKEIYEGLKEQMIDANIVFDFPESYRVVLAWLALLSGDNPTLFSLSKKIDESLLDDNFLAFFEQLKALSGLFGEAEERLTHSLKGMAILGGENRSFFMANALLTHGQILVGLNRLEEGANFFYRAYDLFLEHQMIFPAIVSLTNALLNRFKLGDLDEVKSKIKHAFLVSSSFGRNKHIYLDILRLPLGMCYLEEQRLNLALDNLNKASRAINELKLIHMHGYIEIYLLKTYALMGDTDALKKHIQIAEETFKNMHYPMMGWIVLYGKILLNGDLNKKEKEFLETSLSDNSYKPAILLEMHTYLYNNALISTFNEKLLRDAINNCKITGNVVELQGYLLGQGEYYYTKNNTKRAEAILTEAVAIYRKHGIKSSFYLFPFRFWPIISKLSPEFEIPEKLNDPVESLTTREIEILNLVANGLTNNEIAENFFISTGTVKWHISNILGKFGVKNRVKAVEVARSFGIIK